MLPTIFTRHLLTACFAVALGWAFPWTPVEVEAKIEYFSFNKIREEFFSEISHESKRSLNWFKIFLNNFTKLLNSNPEFIFYIQGYLLGYIIGFVCGWPIADKIGRKTGILYSSLFRFVGTSFLFFLEIQSNKHVNLFLALGFSLGMYDGLLFIIGFMYIYEISPKYSTPQVNLGALPVLALYLLLKYLVQYLSSLFIHLSSNLIQTNYLKIALSLTTGVAQFAIVLKFCVETPSFMIIQRHQYKNAKRILQQLRLTENISDEFKEIKWDRPQHESMKRTSYILMLYFFGLLYNFIFVQIGLLIWIAHGVPLNFAKGIYSVFTLISFLSATFNYGRYTLTIPTTKKLMFRFYTLFSILFISTCILFILKFYDFNQKLNYFVIDSILVIISIISNFVFYSGPTVITTVLILDYPKQACRGNHLVLCILFACVLFLLMIVLFCITLGFLFIILGKLNIYIATLFTAAFLNFLVWLVWVKEGKLDLKDDNDDNDSENIGAEKGKAISLSLLKIYDNV